MKGNKKIMLAGHIRTFSNLEEVILFTEKVLKRKVQFNVVCSGLDDDPYYNLFGFVNDEEYKTLSEKAIEKWGF